MRAGFRRMGALRLVLLALVAWSLGSGCAIAAAAKVAAPSPSQQILVLLRLPPDHISAGADYGAAYDDGPGHDARRRIASQIAYHNDLILAEDWPMPLLGLDCYVMTVPTGRDLGSGLINQSQKMTVAAMAMADMKV